MDFSNILSVFPSVFPSLYIEVPPTCPVQIPLQNFPFPILFPLYPAHLLSSEPFPNLVSLFIFLVFTVRIEESLCQLNI